jgi:phosphatidylserine/phosphatidylglycerophosphate/cardiolipin synthase-like enzyme
MISILVYADGSRIDTACAADVIPISEVRENDGSGVPKLLGQEVTVMGEVTASDQLGIKAAIQDTTAGVIIYDGSFADSVDIGDIVTVTGTVTQYSGLTELDPVTILDRVQQPPTIVPLVLTCNDIARDGRGGLEKYEGTLVRINDVTVNTNKWTVSGSGTNYNLSDASGSCEIRIDKFTNIANTLAPQGSFDVIGVVGQYDYSSPYTSGYQLMPRFINDIISDTGPRLLSGPLETDITPESITITWKTDSPANSIVMYGTTVEYEIDTVIVNEAVTSHTYIISDLSPAIVYHIKVGASDASGTSYSGDHISITASDPSSTGAMHVYFNRTVDTTLAVDGNAAYGNQDMAQRFIDRVESAQFSIDVCFYSWNLKSVTDALIAARNRGVSVRFIHDDEHLFQSEVNRLMGSGIRVINDSYGNNDGEGLQHNKFAIFDARDETYAFDDWVWTGSLNFTAYQQTGINAIQNVIEIQDQSLAKAYTMEFNEMWGSETSLPSASNSRFGVKKSDNTPHLFMINGTRVENYMSPSDQITSKLINAVNTADHGIYFCILEFTRIDLKTAMGDKYFNRPDFHVRGVFDSDPDPASQWESMSGEGPYAWDPPADVWLDTEAGVLHHKYMIIDGQHPASDPVVITGSNNWSSSAENKNNENVLIIYDADIANLYIQEFAARYHAAGGTGDFIPTSVSANQERLPEQFQLAQNYPNPFNPGTSIQFQLPGAAEVNLAIYNISGRLVRTLVAGAMAAGSHTVRWEGDDSAGQPVSSGVYMVRIKSGNKIMTRKMMMIR